MDILILGRLSFSVDSNYFADLLVCYSNFSKMFQKICPIVCNFVIIIIITFCKFIRDGPARLD